jgi:hypothetical protein
MMAAFMAGVRAGGPGERKKEFFLSPDPSPSSFFI